MSTVASELRSDSRRTASANGRGGAKARTSARGNARDGDGARARSGKGGSCGSSAAKKSRPSESRAADKPAAGGKLRSAPWTVPELLARAFEPPESKASYKQPPISLKDYFKRPQTKAYLDWYDKKVYAPIRRVEQRLREEDERLRIENRILNLRWRLDAIDSEFDAVSKELDFIIKVVMDSYGCHSHRGEWRRRHCGKRERQEQRVLQNKDFLRARHVTKHGPRRPSQLWDYYLKVAQTVSLRPDPNSSTPEVRHTIGLETPASPFTAAPSAGGATCQVVSSASASSTAMPSAVREGSTFSRLTSNSSSSAAAPPSTDNSTNPSGPDFSPPSWSQLPYDPPFNPLFARAMDGTTFLTPRTNPPERPTWTPYVRPKRRRRPSGRQVRKLYDDFLFNGDPPPKKGASRYTDIRVFLAELTPNCWRRYGSYFYDFLKRKLPADLRNRKRRKKPNGKSRTRAGSEPLAKTQAATKATRLMRGAD